ncbi:MurR/RpiR family transcriptional regulator [Alkalihalobacillus sp. NPDC078783]
MEQLTYTLLAYINNSLEKDINDSIARSFLQHIHNIETFSLDSVAEICNVAPSTINRFCKRIGFRNFSSLRKSVILAKKTDPTAGTSQHVLDAHTFKNQFQENIDMIDQIQLEQINRLVKRLKNSQRIVILSFERYQIQTVELQKKLLLLGKFCECSTNLFKQMKTLDDLTEDDLIIMISIQGHLLNEELPLIKKLRESNGHKWLITFSDRLGELAEFDDVIQCGLLKNHAVSSHTLLRLFDMLEQWMRERP